MRNSPPDPEFKSAERLAFEIYLRTGRRLASPDPPERKFNPYHDPRNGQFTFAPGGPRSAGGALGSSRRSLSKRKPAFAQEGPAKPVDASTGVVAGERNAARSAGLDARAAAQELNQYRPNPRARMGGNGGPPISDPLILTQAIPALQDSPAGAIVAVPAGFLDLTGPASNAIGGLHEAFAKSLIKQIQAIDPDYRYESLGPTRTFEGRVNEINKLRFDRAVALYRARDDASALQVEVLRFIQARVDAAYDRATALYEAGELPRGRSRNHAIGNYIGMRVRRELQERLNFSRIDHTSGRVRVIGRQYNTSGAERTYVVPDARVDFGDYDWTMEAKTPGKRQVRGFFNSDLRPHWTAIIRPSQLGEGHSYFIKSPRQ